MAIPIDKPTDLGIVVSALQIIQPDLFVVVVSTISEGVDGCDTNRILRNSTYTPRIVGVSCNGLCILINNSDYVALQVLYKVIRSMVVKNTTGTILVI